MQVYLQFKYYITVTKTGDGTPYRSHEYVLLRFRGNVVMKMGTQQQHFMQQRIFRPIYIFNNYAYFLDFRAQKFPLIFLNLNPF